ncbi:hypothetical protein J6I75_07330 [Pseudidiomarina sp. 1APP75-27a]|uniref:DUF6088 family protein n=1 Tax=Pseudidiomarina terrestris TaxID=2820060 RepID=UPI002B05AD1A|nr:DUF6088 family protein [Pseudidiomarina sp. 1APP75-27a]MEA3588162.1 hypothetical protein [Pseudidiomarina sp. 1APP75-27a]
MPESIESRVISRVYGKGRGWSFSRIDFSDLGSVEAIDQSLSRLAKAGRIRRLLRGLYDFPQYSSFLEKELSPDMHQVARAIARKFGWNIQVSENTALNILGLSTQVPTRYVYQSDGRSHTYKVSNQELVFVKARLKDTGFKHEKSALLVQALRGIGQDKVSESERKIIRAYFDTTDQKHILRDARYVTSWVYEEIKQIFKDES